MSESVTPPWKASAHPGSATKSLPLTDATTWSMDSEVFVPTAIHVGGSGNIVGKLQEDTENRTFAVIAGMMYPYSFKYIDETSTATGLIVIRGRA